MGAEEGDGAGEGAAGAEVGHVAEGEPLQLLVLLQWEVLELGLELCGLLRIKNKQTNMLKKHKHQQLEMKEKCSVHLLKSGLNSPNHQIHFGLGEVKSMPIWEEGHHVWLLTSSA